MPDPGPSDIRFLQMALALAARGLGKVAPNPAVGCVLVKDGHVVGRGHTQKGGRPHAETMALDAAGKQAEGACAYVTLEPCAHHGVTPPCAEALVATGVARVVVAATDPDPRVCGKGVAHLRAAGIEVVEDVLAPMARALNLGFFLKVLHNRPLVSAKLALSLDGRVATRTGDSQWVTGDQARNHGHLMRARHDAILVGAGTLIADDPRLDCRLPGLEGESPRPVVMLRKRALPQDAKLRRRADLLVLDHLDPQAALARLCDEGITRLLIEGGPRLITSFLRAGLVDQLLVYRAGRVIGGDGLAAIADMGIDDLADTPVFSPILDRSLGEDRFQLYINPRGFEEVGAACSPVL